MIIISKLFKHPLYRNDSAPLIVIQIRGFHCTKSAFVCVCVCVCVRWRRLGPLCLFLSLREPPGLGQPWQHCHCGGQLEDCQVRSRLPVPVGMLLMSFPAGFSAALNANIQFYMCVFMSALPSTENICIPNCLSSLLFTSLQSSSTLPLVASCCIFWHFTATCWSVQECRTIGTRGQKLHKVPWSNKITK